MSPIITYSPAYTIVPTYECFNRCTYCNFRTEPNQDIWLTLETAEEKLKSLKGTGVIEILILSGEVHPHSKRRGAWLQRIYDLAKLALDLGFLPHTNAGILTWEEMKKLKQVNVSMGLMLEQVTSKLLETVHRYAPSKIPQVRLEQLEWAGKLQIPFTTGLLLGIGETESDWEETLAAITRIQQSWGHIQEVILQPHSPGKQQSLDLPSFNLNKLPEVIALARRILPPEVTIQIPPNLISQPQFLLDCLAAGARDLGGISPKDEVNPDYPHLQVQWLADVITPQGYKLESRLPIYPQYYGWLSESIQVV